MRANLTALTGWGTLPRTWPVRAVFYCAAAEAADGRLADCALAISWPKHFFALFDNERPAGNNSQRSLSAGRSPECSICEGVVIARQDDLRVSRGSADAHHLIPASLKFIRDHLHVHLVPDGLKMAR